jgi:transposase
MEVPMLFPPWVLERAMKVKEVIMRALNKEYSWLQAAEILGISVRGLRRLRERMETVGFEGLIDMRCGRPSPRRTPVAEVERILGLYRDRYSGYNARHFYQTVRREHGVELSYTHVRQLLQGAGLRKKGRARGRHRMRRERKACFGEMLHLDGSLHEWVALLPGEKQTLIQVVDDATSQVLYAQLWESETSLAVMSALKEVIGKHGIPMSLYTDRAGWAFETPKAGAKVDKSHMTQVGQALARLGIEHIPSYSPQARGRSERMNRTLQDRLVNELKAAKINTVEEANRYLKERYLPTHNEALAKPPQDPTSVFVELGEVDLDEIFFEETVRTVAKDNTVTHHGVRFQIHPQPGRRSCAGLAVQVRRHLDGTYSIRRGAQLFGYYDENAEPVETAGPVENRKRPQFPTRTLDAGKRNRRPQLPQAPARS